MILNGKGLKRCFIALEFPREIINEIRLIQKRIGNKFVFTGKFTEPENLHLTLKFLGEINEGKILEVKKRLKKVHVSEFVCSLGRVGVFSKARPKIVWVGLKGADKLQKEIDSELDSLFRKENRFMSHVTIARVRYVREKKEFVEYLNCLKGKEEFKVNKFYLKESELKPYWPEYRDIESYKLM